MFSSLYYSSQPLAPVFIPLSYCQDVNQDPEISWSYLSESAEMNCSHKKDAGHNQMYWYRQRPGETMKLIVYTVLGGQPDYVGRLLQTNIQPLNRA
ncbi:hypothetical protein L3Q82_026162 [Scortum barcoo]|uniref:Uncharacterized protein n=1 Tax=Scortum barcoo TaxID=214431 RepID=A0ACB8WH42_9TELE|nr:hypothetical protein L3Q82_026162 [Scortum barcoo]